MPDTGNTAYEGQDLEALADLKNYQNWIMESFGPFLKGTVLEVGAGSGNISRLYVDSAEKAVLLEPAANLIRILQNRFAGRRHVEIVSQYLEEAMQQHSNPLPRQHFDAALLVNVLEHVDDDVGMLKRLRSLLKPGAHLLLFVPAGAWLYGSLDRICRHVQRYSYDRLAGVVKTAGFTIHRLHYFDAPGVLPWFVVGRLLKQQRFHAAQAQRYDRFAVPVIRRLEQKIRPPFGKNLLCIAKREE
ncbi:methyltransferase domain-containing protein [candidate division KSB1 bacterium]|nr:methyltransferase domain-containing protein [candidate division KSB1 bacterium]